MADSASSATTETTNRIDGIRQLLGPKKETPGQDPGQKIPPSAEQPKGGNNDGKAAEPAPMDLDPEVILALLEMPFMVAEAQTGFAYSIPPKFKKPLSMSCQKAVQDFGIEVVSKWLNLGVLVGLYGYCMLDFTKGMREHLALKALEEKKKKEAKENVIVE